MNQPINFKFIPTFTAINQITSMKGTELNSGMKQTYFFIMDIIMMVGKGKGAQFTHQYLADRTGVTIKTARVTVKKLVEMGLVGTSKGCGKTTAYFMITPPYNFPGITEEESKEIEEAWNAIYHTDEYGKNIN